MASTKKIGAAAPEVVWLRCEDLGLTKPFGPKHAADLLAFQEARKLTGPGSWQPADAPKNDD